MLVFYPYGGLYDVRMAKRPKHHRSIRRGRICDWPEGVGTPDQVVSRLRELERIGIDLVLIQCSPQREEMDRFAAEVFPLVGRATGS